MPQQKLTVPPPLSAQDRSSFAYTTIKDRLPVIIVKTIDFFHRQRKELFKLGGTINAPTEVELAEIEKDAKDVIAYLSKLRKELETNKPVTLLEKLDLSPELARFNDDVDIWNLTLNSSKLDDGSLPRWFDSPWLLVECYLYRRIKDAMLRTKHLNMFDPFVEQKQAACRAAKPQMVAISHRLADVEKTIIESTNKCHPSERKEFNIFIQLALWANKSDLSISGMSADKIQLQKAANDISESLDELQENILCNNSSELWIRIQNIKDKLKVRVESQERGNQPTGPMYIDLVADNSGYELFVDLCLVDFLGLIFSQDSKVVKFRIHVKRMPWFVSDTVRHDIDWLLDFMTDSNQESSLIKFGSTWKSFLENGLWEIHDHLFWTLPHDFSEMAEVAQDLHSLLSTSSLIIFKGDLNYRKLTGDRKWHLLTPFGAALRGFGPAPLVALRTAKADVVVGIEDINIFAQINNNELPRDWMISGNYGLIQTFYIVKHPKIHDLFLCNMFRCDDPGCEEKFDNRDEFTVHTSYHAYHQRIKDEGKKELDLLERRFNTTIKCPLAADHFEGCYYFPQLPLKLICEWYECGYEFFSAEKFYDHVSQHAHRLVDRCYWDNCNRPMKKVTLQLLREHLRVHTLQKLYACPYCGNFFSTKIKFDDHFLRHLPMPAFLQDQRYDPKITKKKDGELQYNVEEYDVDDCQVKIFRCTYTNCDKTFLTSSLLREHIRIHSNKNQCDQCSYVAKSSSRLESHKLYRHKTDRNYECTICLKTFKQRGDLRAHVRRHQIVEPYRCDKCDFETLNEEGLNTHAKLHDRNHDYCCHICQRVFSRGNNLSRHLKDQHKLQLPNGQSRFKYKLIDEGVYLLDTCEVTIGESSNKSSL